MIEQFDTYKPDRETQADEILKYGMEHYSDYLRVTHEGKDAHYEIKGQPELESIYNELLNKYFGANEAGRVPDEWIDKLYLTFYATEDEVEEDNDYKEEVLHVLNMMNFDVDSVVRDHQSDEEIWQSIKNMYKKIYAYKTYEDLMNKIDLKYIGFDNEQSNKIKKTIQKIFSAEFIKKCAISQICNFPFVVSVQVKGQIFLLPIEKYKEFLQSFPGVEDYKCRAESMPAYNDGETEFIDLPIFLFSFYGENTLDIDYLSEFNDEEKNLKYQVGTIAHEIGHMAYCYQTGLKEKKEWKKIIDKTGHLTKYSGKYSSGMYGKNLRYDEEFAEAVRLYTTSFAYLKEKFQEVFEFIEKHYEGITPMENE